MKDWRAVGLMVVAASGSLFGVGEARRLTPQQVQQWNPQAAASYLDDRQSWWEGWSRAARDHNTACVSCHTALPYVLARPELRAALHETGTTPEEQKLFKDVTTRVRAWDEVEPWYGDATPKGHPAQIQSRATEAVVNAFVLAWRDRLNGAQSVEARQAFANMFALQLATGDSAGSWRWQSFGLHPWESETSPYFGAALAAIAVANEPQGYANSPAIRGNLGLLETFLRTHTEPGVFDRLRLHDDATLLNDGMLLWAASGLPDLISNEQRHDLIVKLEELQRSDGGWSLADLGHWYRRGGGAVNPTSDGYGTGFVVYVLELSGVPVSEAHVGRGRAWLVQHQDSEGGMWYASSLNKQRDPESDIGKFMSDAATGFAVLALTTR